jgi:hypothetical protein
MEHVFISVYFKEEFYSHVYKKAALEAFEKVQLEI